MYYCVIAYRRARGPLPRAGVERGEAEVRDLNSFQNRIVSHNQIGQPSIKGQMSSIQPHTP